MKVELVEISRVIPYARNIGLNNRRGNKGPLIKSHLYHILQDSFYYGIMKVKRTGEEFPHRYETIIPKSLYDTCQIVRTGKGRPHSRYAGKDYVFRGLLTCAVTGRMCTAETSKKKYASGEFGEWTYVIAYREDAPEKKVWVREDDVEAQVIAALEKLAIKDKGYYEDVIGWIESTHNAKKDHHRKQTAMLKHEHTELETKLEGLMDLRISGEISKEEFMVTKKRLKDRQIEITELVHAYDVTDDEFNNRLCMLLNVAYHAAEGYKGSGINEKRELLSFVFQNLTLKEKKLEYTMRYPFNLFADANKTGEWCTSAEKLRTGLANLLRFYKGWEICSSTQSWKPGDITNGNQLA